MNPTRIILLCSSRLALPTLQQLAFLGVLAAVVVPAHRDEWAENAAFVLKQTNIPLLRVNKASFATDMARAIEEHTITVGLMVTFSFLVPASVYTLPPQGFYNVHPGPLPQYRGADPVFQQIKNREKQAGVTIHRVDSSFDTGPVVMQEMIRLRPTDTYGMLTTQLAQVAARLTLTLLKLLSFEVAVPLRPQDETKARYFKKHVAKEVSINWQEMDDVMIIALINACNPWNKGASTLLNGQIVRLLEAETLRATTPLPDAVLPGTLLGFENEKLLVATLNNKVLGIKLLHTEEGFLSGGRLPACGFVPGQRFETLL